MAHYAQPKMDELRQKYIEKIRTEIEQATIEKLQSQLDADMAGSFKWIVEYDRMMIIWSWLEKLAQAEKAKEEKQLKEVDASNLEDEETTMEPNENGDADKPATIDEKDPEAEEGEAAESAGRVSPQIVEAQSDDLSGAAPQEEQILIEPPAPITAQHPDVIREVENAVEEARNAAVNIPADVYAELIFKAIQSVEQEQREKNPNGPL